MTREGREREWFISASSGIGDWAQSNLPTPYLATLDGRYRMLPSPPRLVLSTRQHRTPGSGHISCGLYADMRTSYKWAWLVLLEKEMKSNNG